MGWGADTASLSDSRALQQRRVALFLKFQSVLIGSFYLLDTIDPVRARGLRALGEPGLVLHLTLEVGLLSAWLFVRAGERSRRLVQVVDSVATLSICVAAMRILSFTNPVDVAAGPMFATAITLVARAAIVPSRGVFTLLLGSVVTVALDYTYRRHQPDIGHFSGFVLPWMVAFTLASAFVSRTIYGLQRQVREASQLGQYVLESKLGEGGMGVVYRARHSMLRRPTAVKVLLPDRSGEQNVARFEREVRQTARLTHPNTVTIYDYGRTPDGFFYYAMELLVGANLEDIVRVGGPQSPARVIRTLASVAGALSEAHGTGLIHRDIKPANIMLCEQGGAPDVAKVLDFGLVKEIGTAVELTLTNSLMGTPLYMSPESIRSPEAVDARSDLYSLGAVAYYLLSGQHVFEGQSVMEVCTRHLVTLPVPPSERLGRRLPDSLERLVLRCLDKDPSARPQTAAELRDQLIAIDDAGSWSEVDGRNWWAANGPALRARHENSPVTGKSRTLAVDLFQRS
jgi:eukaryotic-like serine/threonine-protein kinase